MKRRRTQRWRARGGAIVAPDPRVMLGLAAPARARAGIGLAIALSIALHAAGVAWLGRSAPPPPIEPAPTRLLLLHEPGPPPLAATPTPPAPARAAPPSKLAAERAVKPPVRAAPKPAPTPVPRVPAPPAATSTTSSAAPLAERTPPVSAGVPSGGAAGAGAGADAIHAYVASVLRRIDAEKRYPALARSRGVEGTVVVTLWISPGGALDRIEIGDQAPPLLAASTREAVRKASPFPPPPSGLPSIRIPVRYALR